MNDMTSTPDLSKECASQNNPDPKAFWNMNVPTELQTRDCPEFLQYALTNEKDRRILSTLDANYHRHTWQDVQRFIIDNRLDLFERLPSDLRRYREYCAKLETEYGSVMQFVLQERLKWQDLKPTMNGHNEIGMVWNTDDYKILRNDWPYGIDERIIHIVVWTKFEFETAPVSESDPVGDLTPETRQTINRYVDETFASVCGKDNVIWFKNWSSLKSIHTVEHFHVMLFDPDMQFVDRITGGDVPLAEKVKMREERKA